MNSDRTFYARTFALVAAVVLFAGFVYLARRWLRAKGF